MEYKDIPHMSLRAPDDSMLAEEGPSIEQGQTVHVVPRETLSEALTVVVRAPDGQILIRDLSGDYLVPRNPDYPTIKAKSGTVIIGTVVDGLSAH